MSGERRQKSEKNLLDLDDNYEFTREEIIYEKVNRPNESYIHPQLRMDRLN